MGVFGGGERRRMVLEFPKNIHICSWILMWLSLISSGPYACAQWFAGTGLWERSEEDPRELFWALVRKRARILGWRAIQLQDVKQSQFGIDCAITVYPTQHLNGMVALSTQLKIFLSPVLAVFKSPSLFFPPALILAQFVPVEVQEDESFVSTTRD